MIERYELLREASVDPALANIDVRVFIILLNELNFEDFRPVKRAWLATILSIHPTTASRSLQRLVEHGRLECQRRQGESRLYRLPAPPRCTGAPSRAS